MALIDEATLVPGQVHYFLAPVGTAAPSDLSVTPATPWVELGHTSIEDLMGFDSEGGDQTVLGTAQNASLRTSQSRRTESFSINLMQFDIDSLKLFFGSNATEVGGWLYVPDAPAPTPSAFLAVFTDGSAHFGFHAARAEILRGDNLSFDDTENFASLPLKITPTKYGSNPGPYAVTPIEVETP